jgi:hypothetical protein
MLFAYDTLRETYHAKCLVRQADELASPSFARRIGVGRPRAAAEPYRTLQNVTVGNAPPGSGCMEAVASERAASLYWTRYLVSNPFPVGLKIGVAGAGNET